MNEIDEVGLVAALRPEPPGDVEQIRQRARTRLEAAFAPAPAGSRERAGSRWQSRRSLGLAGAAVAVIAGAAIVVPSVLPAGGSGSFVTDAWAVKRSADGTITVTINRALARQSQLQADLRKDGVKAYVRPMSKCSAWEPQGGFKLIRQDWNALLFPAPGNHDKDFGAIIIHPARIPSGYAVFIGGSGGASGLSLQMYLMPGDSPPICASQSHPAPSRR